MKKLDRYRYLLMLIIVFLFGNTFCFAKGSMVSLAISTASHEELVEMASLRGLSLDQDDEKLRSLLYTFEGVTPPEKDSEEAKEYAYQLSVQQAQRLEKNSSNSLVTLLGSVKASFLLDGETVEKMLGSNKMLVDTENTIVSAMGAVNYQDKDKKAAVQSMQGDIISLGWKDSSLTITNGTTETQRTNSEDDKISFYTSGDEIRYRTKDGAILFDQGYITNNPKHAYSSISAKKLAMLDTGDMVLEYATISIGRVPVLWVPQLLFPGSKMFGSPAIGYESTRGFFVNTTFMVYGKMDETDSSASSFTRLLETDDGTTKKTKDGPIYRKLQEGEELSSLEKWAQDSGSYLAIEGDSYQNSGLAAGLESLTNLWSKKLSLSALARIAVTPDGKESVTTYASFPKFRYQAEGELKFTTSSLNLTFSIPIVSDPKVKKAYANRFTGFSIDHLFGAKWPTTYASDITSYTLKATGSFSLPSKWKTAFLDTLSISSLQANAVYSWNKPTGESEYKYRLSSVTLPTLQASIGGSFFSFDSSKTGEKAKEKKQAEEKAEADKAKEEGEGHTPEEKEAMEGMMTVDAIVNEMLKSAYKAPSSITQTTKPTHSISLSYSGTESLSQTAKSVSSVFDWDATHYLSSITSGTLTLKAVPDSRFFTITQTVTPKYTYTIDKSKTAWKTKSFLLSASTVASIPLIGLTYTFSEKLYTYTETTSTTTSGTDETTTEQGNFQFTTDYVTTHQLALSKSFQMGEGSLTPSLTYVLPPLSQSLLPALSYKIGKWAFTNSFKFLQDNGALSKNLITSLTTYSSTYLNLSVKGTYQCADLSGGDYWAPFGSVGSLSLTFWGMTVAQSYDYSAASSYGKNYFSSLASSFSYGPLKTTFTLAGTADQIAPSTWVTKLSLTSWKLQWWKQRCSLSVNLDTTLTIDYKNSYSTNLAFKAGFTFSIAEFLDFTFSITSANTSFFMYRKSNGSFDWGLMFQDFFRSFDFINGGNRRTNFNMSAMSLEVVHYMEDWTLNCKYSGSVVLSNNRYSWVPQVTVFLQWKTLPELKVDEKWTKEAGATKWTATSST